MRAGSPDRSIFFAGIGYFLPSSLSTVDQPSSRVLDSRGVVGWLISAMAISRLGSEMPAAEWWNPCAVEMSVGLLAVDQ